MVLRLRERLLSGFLGVSLLVLLVGGAGVFLIDRVSEASNRILDEKIPLQSRAEFLLLSVEKTIALSRDYLLSLDADAAAEILNQIEIESASVDNLLQLLESDSIRTERDHVAEVYESLTAAVERLAEAHDQRVAYWFMFDGKEKDLKTFVLEQSVALNEWLNALEESVKFDVPFGGNLELSQNDYMRWYSEYETEDPALKKLLKKYAKVNNKIFKFANKVNRASGKKKLSHFQRGQSRQIIKARKGLNAIIKYITPVVDHALKAERVSMNEMNGIATEIELSIHALRMVIEQEVKAARQEVEETQKLAWVTLLSGSAIAVVLGILVALYIARSVVNPVNRLKRLMSEVSGRGDFSQRVENPTEDEVGETAVTLNTLLDSLQGAIGEIGEVMSASAEGDFSRRVESDLPGDLDRLKHSINGSVERTQEAISRVNGVMRAVEAGDFEQRIEEGFGGELHTFRNTVNGALDSLQQMTENLSLVMQAIINGNFNYRMTGAGGSEI
ncbi:MAG: HAMP domain-containing protein [Gammaproteobacteria bacterium]|nr:HAMP domain-containing protein [Gammaproteobacteria bacterium]MBT7307379.1 HAMP domain-containing protein [Gammaproteobacteria bacterium]